MVKSLELSAKCIGNLRDRNEDSYPTNSDVIIELCQKVPLATLYEASLI